MVPENYLSAGLPTRSAPLGTMGAAHGWGLRASTNAKTVISTAKPASKLSRALSKFRSVTVARAAE